MEIRPQFGKTSIYYMQFTTSVPSLRKNRIGRQCNGGGVLPFGKKLMPSNALTPKKCENKWEDEILRYISTAVPFAMFC
jgi:hypothetical protein